MKRLTYYVVFWLFSLGGVANAQPNIKSESIGQQQSSATSSVTKKITADRILAQIAPSKPTLADALSQAPADRSVENRSIDIKTDRLETVDTDNTARPEMPPGFVVRPQALSRTPEDRSLENQLIDIKNDRPETADKYNTYQPETSPGFSVFNPVGFGADNNLLFLSLSYQNRTRFTRTADGEAGIGFGLGDATKSIGVELSYGIDSFGSSAGFGSGGFNAKLHKRLNDDASVAVGWNQFARLQFRGGANVPSDYPRNSYYVVGTNIFHTREDINAPFSRVAISGGIGSGVFLRFDPKLSPGDSNRGVNVFGSIGVRIARPISAIIEWTGQDVGVGLSIAPFKDIPLVITPAIRDIAGAGDGARFILGSSIAINF